MATADILDTINLFDLWIVHTAQSISAKEINAWTFHGLIYFYKNDATRDSITDNNACCHSNPTGMQINLFDKPTRIEFLIRYTENGITF